MVTQSSKLTLLTIEVEESEIRFFLLDKDSASIVVLEKFFSKALTSAFSRGVVDYRKGGPRNFLRAPISLPRYSLSFQKRITPQLGESEFQILLIKRCDESGHQGKLIFPWKIILVAERMSQRTRCNDFLLHFGIIP